MNSDGARQSERVRGRKMEGECAENGDSVMSDEAVRENCCD